MVYKYEWGGYKYSVPAQVVGEECERIEKENGSLTCESLVDSARSKSSAIHGLFEWNNKIAGEKWRLQQAKTILCCLKVTVTDVEEQTPVKVRAFLNANPTDARAEYFNIQKTLADVNLMSGVLSRAKKELQIFTDKYRKLEELAPVISSIDDFLDKEKT